MHLRNNRIQQLEVDNVSLFAHDARVAVVTVHYSGILGYKDNTRWAFDIDAIYSGKPRADAEALTATFTEEEAESP
jgi:hypothetical protein